MQLVDTLVQRKSVRAFLNQPVELDKIHTIFD